MRVSPLTLIQSGGTSAASPLPTPSPSPGPSPEPPAASNAPSFDTFTPFGSPIEARVPMPIRAVWGTITGLVRKGVDFLVPEEADTPDGAQISKPLDRAKEAQRALIDEHGMFGTSHRFHANHGPWREEIWPMSQVLHGRIVTAMSDGSWGDVEKIMRDIEVYRSDDGFNGGIGSSERYYDDNAWIGLAAMQAYGATDDPRYLAHAERTFKMVKSGEHKDGGLYWLEQDRSTRNTCAIAPAAELATHLYQATGKKEYLDFAVDQAEWLNKNLRLDSGLYGDNLGDDGKRNDHVYSYNQGTPIGLDVQLYKATGDAKYLARAKETATAAVKYYSDDGILWGDAPVFNTILFRNLMALDAIAPDPSYTKLLDKYLDRVWNEARNPETGLFSEGGIGTYVKDKRGAVIDQGALSQLFAIRALNRSQRAELT